MSGVAGPLAASAVLAVAVSPASAPATATVRLQNVALHPGRVVIKRGGSVRWVWLDAAIDTEHNVTSTGGGPRFASSRTMRSGSYAVRFTRAGIYRYQCTIHPASMQGEVIVE
jgi:plastocyanin